LPLDAELVRCHCARGRLVDDAGFLAVIDPAKYPDWAASGTGCPTAVRRATIRQAATQAGGTLKPEYQRAMKQACATSMRARRPRHPLCLHADGHAAAVSGISLMEVPVHAGATNLYEDVTAHYAPHLHRGRDFPRTASRPLRATPSEMGR